MEPSSRNRISVDLQDLKALLMERAQSLGVSPSKLVRKALANELGRSAGNVSEPSDMRAARSTGERARLCLRMGCDESAATLAAARRAGMSPGRYVAHLVADVPAVLEGGRHADHVAALIAANAELSTLSRNIHHLINLLRRRAMWCQRWLTATCSTHWTGTSGVTWHLLLAHWPTCVHAAIKPGQHNDASFDDEGVVHGPST
jgi:hypothetical protein